MPKRGGASRHLAMRCDEHIVQAAKSCQVLRCPAMSCQVNMIQKHYSEGRPGRGGHDKVFLGLISHIYTILYISHILRGLYKIMKLWCQPWWRVAT